MRPALSLAAVAAIAAACAIITGVGSAAADGTAQSTYYGSCPGFTATPTSPLTAEPGPADANWPVVFPVNSGTTDFGGPITGVHTDATTLEMASYQRITNAGNSAQSRCDLHADLANTLTVGAGTSGLAVGDPVTVVVTTSLDGTLGYVSQPRSFTADSNATVKFHVTDPNNFGQAVMSYVADGYFSADGFGGDPVTGVGGSITQAYKHDLYMSSNASPSVTETPPEVDDKPLSSWVNAVSYSGAPVDFGDSIGTRSMEFATTIGSTLDISGSIDTTEMVSVGYLIASADLDHGFAASFAPDPGNPGVALTLSTDSAPVVTPTAVFVSPPSASYVYGDRISLGVRVGADGGVPTGTVSVSDGAVSLGTLQLDSLGNATFRCPAAIGNSPLSVGTHQLTFAYGGDPGYAPSSAVLPITVVKAVTTTKLTLTPAPVRPNAQARLAATVSTVWPGVGAPTGSVTFFDGAKPLGAAAVVSGEAMLWLDGKQLVGKHVLTATYAGDATHATSSASFTTPKG